MKKHISASSSLDLSAMKCCEVPTKLIRKSTKELDLSFNNIQIIHQDDFSHIRNLKTLNISSNKLKQFSSCLLSIEELYLQFNQIVSLENSFNKFSSLKTLRLDNNRIRNITIESVSSLVNLSHLDVSSNHLENLDFLCKLQNLKQLYCSHNQIKSVKNKFINQKLLLELDLSYNKLNSLCENSMFGNLKVLKLSGNSFEDFSSFQKLNNLQELQIDSNKITKLCGVSNKFPKIEILWIHMNLIESTNELVHLKIPCLREITITENPVVKCHNSSAIDYLTDLHLDYVDIFHQKGVCGRSYPNEVCDQLAQSKTYLDEIAAELTSRFLSLNLMLKELPDGECIDAIQQQIKQRDHPIVDRPQSRCSSRVKIEAARKFAKVNYSSR